MLSIFSSLVAKAALIASNPAFLAVMGAVDETFKTVINTLTTYVTIAGGLIVVWGAVILGSNLKDHNGAGMTNGIWTAVGGAVIIAAAALFNGIIT